MSSSIADNLAWVNERIRQAEHRAGRPENSVRLVGVTKNRTVEQIEAAVAAGLVDIGENRFQEAAEKFPRLKSEITFTRHFIGHLQRNKARQVLGLFDTIQSVDSERLALALDGHAAGAGIRPRVLIQVNTSGEESKFGVQPGRCENLLEVTAGLGNLELVGLMTIGPLSPDAARIKKSFNLLRNLFDRYAGMRTGNCRMEILSMGMSSDFETAIAEGSNMVRVGTAIFGPRAE
ncbi:MAG: YggS family pyridoxal phosphate-dependent enzyme [Gemmatimonadota bacterium]|nr:YggS family pyridoxal phosphate-dependent enzyme [Gemmatimonadota bacterium]